MAEPPPVGGQTGATTEPTTSLRRRALSASRFTSSSEPSMLKCGEKRNRSKPSNFTPSTSAAAVRSSMVSRSIGGSESGPLPTTPGQDALCSLGKLLGWLATGDALGLGSVRMGDRIRRGTGIARCKRGIARRRRWTRRRAIRLLGLAPGILADVRQLVVNVGTEITQADERLVAGVFDLDAGRGRFVADEDFVFGLLRRSGSWPGFAA